MTKTVELDDLIREREESDPRQTLDPINFGAFIGRLSLLLGFIIGMQMPVQHTMLLTIGALLAGAWFALNAWRNPGKLQRPRWTTINVKPSDTLPA